MAKVMVSMPDELLGALDAAARDASLNRSELIRDAVRLYLATGAGTPDLARRSAAVARLKRRFEGVTVDAAKAVRAERSR